jgi:hypothetical protein
MAAVFAEAISRKGQVLGPMTGRAQLIISKRP